MDGCDPSSSSTDWDDLRALSPPHRVFSRTRRDEALPANSLQDGKREREGEKERMRVDEDITDQNNLMGLRSRFSSMSAETEVKTVGMGVILEANVSSPSSYVFSLSLIYT